MSSTEQSNPPAGEPPPQDGGQHTAEPPPEPTPAEASAEQPGDAPSDAPSDATEPSDAPSAEGTAAEVEGTPLGAGPAAEGGEHKKRRRRRRKKKGDHTGPPGPGGSSEEGAVATGQPTQHADGQTHGGGPPHEERRGQRPPRREGPPRERPVFNVGDVVFGKIVELLEDAMIVDMPGHGRAIFDRAEMDLPEEPAQGPGSEIDENEEDDAPLEALAEKAKELLTAPVVGEPAPDAPPAGDEVRIVEAPKNVEAAPEPRRPPPPPAEDPIIVTLPPVVLEIGASFVGVVHNDGGRGGYVVLTRHPRRVRRAKPIVALAFKEQTPIKGLVTGAIKGGIEVDIDGLRAFAPASHVDLRHSGDLRHMIGKRLDFFVTQYGKRGRDVVLTRKALLEAEAKHNRAHALSKLVPGTIIEGIVRSIVPFGAFIDVGGVEGLVPLSEMSHNRGDQPGDVFEQGQTVQVQVQRIDVKGKIWLSRKACLPDPWMEAVKKFEVGSRHTGKVARIQPFGVFVELEPGIDGLIHTSDLTMKPIKHPSEIVKVGEEIEVTVASTDGQGHRIALHPVVPGMEGEAPQKVVLHRTVKVVVTAIEQAGLVVRILGVTGRNGRGFITSAGTGTPRGTDLRRGFPVGSMHDAKIIEMDPRRGDIKLSIKAMHEDSERTAYKQYKQQVSREAKFGTFGDLLAKKLDKPS